MDHQPLVINGKCVERVLTCKLLGTYIAEDLTWTHNTDCLIGKAQQQVHFPRTLRKINLPRLLVSFYHCSIESALTYGILVWYSSRSVEDKKALLRVIRTTEKITNTHLPALNNIFTSCCLQKATTIIKDSSHCAHHLFELLPSGRQDITNTHDSSFEHFLHKCHRSPKCYYEVTQTMIWE